MTRLYADFKSKLDRVRDAVNPQIDVTTQMLHNFQTCAPTAYTFATRMTVTFLGDAATPAAAVQINYQRVIDRDGEVP